MTLSLDDIKQFYRLHGTLMCHVHQRMKKGKGVSSPEEFRKLPYEEIVKLRKYLFDHRELIDSFLEEDGSALSAEDAGIIQSWKHMLHEEFFIMRHLKNHSVFLDQKEPPHVYGVLPLYDEFEDMLGPRLPVILKTVLLPFKGNIVYDGIMVPYDILFGSGIRQGLNDAYQKAKSRFGIIATLPFSATELERGDAEMLKFYLKSERNRENYWEEIGKLTRKDPALVVLYHQEMGKKDARRYRKQLPKIGVKAGWFAVLEGTIIASGTTKSELEVILERILQAEKQQFVHIFRVKG